MEYNFIYFLPGSFRVVAEETQLLTNILILWYKRGTRNAQNALTWFFCEIIGCMQSPGNFAAIVPRTSDSYTFNRQTTYTVLFHELSSFTSTLGQKVPPHSKSVLSIERIRITNNICTIHDIFAPILVETKECVILVGKYCTSPVEDNFKVIYFTFWMETTVCVWFCEKTGPLCPVIDFCPTCSTFSKMEAPRGPQYSQGPTNVIWRRTLKKIINWNYSVFRCAVYVQLDIPAVLETMTYFLFYL